jgi:hypothetical protein
MIRKILLAGASALALSATAAQASDGCNVSFTAAGSYTCDVTAAGLYDFSVLGAGGGEGGVGGDYGGGGGAGGGGSSFSSLYLLSAVASAAGGAGQDGGSSYDGRAVYSDVGLVSGRIHLAVGDLITFFIGGGGSYLNSGAGAPGAEGGAGGNGGYHVGGVGGLGGGSSYLNGLVTNGVTSTAAVPYPLGHSAQGPDGLISLSLFSADGPGGVPEPATWMILLGGFGFMGYVLRRRIMRRA